MEPGSLSSFRPEKARFVTHDVIYSVRIIRIWFNNLWEIGRVSQRANIFSIGNRNGSWKLIRGIPGYFVWEGTIINGNGRQIQRWDTTINWKGIIEEVINFTIVILSH